MNWSHSSKLALALAAVLFVAAVPAAAVSVTPDGVPDSAEVGSKTTASFEVTDLYSNYDSWTLAGETELVNATWTVTLYDQTNARIGRESYSGQTFQQAVEASEDVNRVEVRVEGTVPKVENYSYQPAQSFTVAALRETQDGGASTTLDAWSARPYTSDSQEARDAIADAEDAIDTAESNGADTTEAEDLLDSAVSAFNGSNFDNAVKLANNAQSKAEGAAASKQQTNLLLMAGAGLVGLLLIGGGVYWYLSNRQTYDKLG
ncbi:hypothetical protein ACFQH6_17245 [Halobacteriaceae archaeon GCM10025711]